MQISSIEYLKRAIAGGAFKYADWHLDTFSVFALEDDVERNYPFVLRVSDDKEYYFIDQNDQTVYTIKDKKYDGRTPFLSFTDRIDVLPGELNNTQTAINTNVGNYVFNATVLHYSFGDKIEFMTGKIDYGRIESTIASSMIDDPEDPNDPILQEKIASSSMFIFHEAVAMMLVYDAIITPSASPKTITGSPKVRALRDKLLKENPTRHDDPTFIAYVKSEMEKLDMEYVDDYGKAFLANNKGSYANVRMLTQGMGPLEDGELTVKSLAEGMDFDKFHLYSNAARSGSINRARNTELGGVQTKRVLQAMQNSNISPTVKDCGVDYGVMRFLNNKNKKNFYGFSIVEKGKSIALSPENIESFVGRFVFMRDPSICKAPAPDYCAVCCGKNLAEHPHGISSASTDLTSRNMYLFMKQMHDSATKLVDFDLHEAVVLREPKLINV